jgi:NADH-quinone oxidoreductase subunit M
LNASGFSGAIFMMIAHGIVTGALFLLSGLLHERTGTLALTEITGVGNRMPWFKTLFTLVLLASIGLPGLVQFPGEVQVLLGAFDGFGLLVILAVLGILITATFTLRVIGGVLFEDAQPQRPALSDLRGVELAAVAPLALFTLVLGVAPGVALSLSRSTIDMLVGRI